MTPKQKAEQLFDKMHTEIYNRDMYNDLFRAKQCALIAVDEILETNPYKARNYWQEVKKEIESL